MKKVTTTTTTVTTTEEIVDDKKQKTIETHYLLILDRSGSMSAVRDVTISGFNEQIQKIKALEAKYPNQKYYISLVTFSSNDDITEIYFDKPVSECKEITKADYDPNGSTALYDAMGFGITKLEEIVKPKYDNEDVYSTSVVVILTDGEENDSKKWTSGKTKELVEGLMKDTRWTISFIGANQDAVLAAKSVGIRALNLGRDVRRSVRCKSPSASRLRRRV